jgi:hypothetical protein
MSLAAAIASTLGRATARRGDAHMAKPNVRPVWADGPRTEVGELRDIA